LYSWHRFYQTGAAHSEAKVIAKYNSGNVLAAELEVANQVEKGGKKGLVISLNAFLPNSSGTTSGWPDKPENDMMLWVANACRYALRRHSTGS